MEDDRAAKAARAKALLNKRRAGAGKAPATGTAASKPATSSPSSAHPSPPPSTYAPSVTNPASPPQSVINLNEEETRSEVGSQGRPATPDQQKSPQSNGHDPYAALVASRIKSPLSSPPQTVQEDSQLQSLIRDQQQTINLLVSEKASLAAALERLEGLDEKYGLVSGQLEASRRAAGTLEGRSHELEQELTKSQRLVEQLTATEKETRENLKQKERDLDILRKEAEDSQAKANQLDSKLRDLQEQIQADDRVEKLQASLKGAQERSDSLESQLARVKQSLTQTKTEKEDALAKFKTLKAAEEKLQADCTSLNKQNTDLKTQLETTTTERDSLKTSFDDLNAQTKKHTDTIAELTRKLSVESGKITMHEKKIKSLQTELAAANKRADEAEHAHKGLQNENVGLMSSLNEMRPKITQLTNDKLELSEQIEAHQRERRELEDLIAKMETAAEEARVKFEALEGEKREIEASRAADKSNLNQEAEKLQQTLSQTEEELQTALSSIRDLEMERTIHRQAVERYQVEMDRLDADFVALRAEFTTLQDDYAAAQNARERDAAEILASHEVVQRANAEVETLRNDLFSKEEEIQDLKDRMADLQSPRTNEHDGHRNSLDREMVAAEESFELSSARSKVRSLETTLFQEQAKTHSLRKQVSSLEEELHRVRRTSRPVHHHNSANVNATPSPSRSQKDLPTQSAIDSNLPPDVQHKRKISLSMLQARINGEAALKGTNGRLAPTGVGIGASPRSYLSRDLPSSLGTTREEKEVEDVEEEEGGYMDEENRVNEKTAKPLRSGEYNKMQQQSLTRIEKPRPQFLDDSHVFWCSCCRGDLVVL